MYNWLGKKMEPATGEGVQGGCQVRRRREEKSEEHKHSDFWLRVSLSIFPHTERLIVYFAHSCNL